MWYRTQRLLVGALLIVAAGLTATAGAQQPNLTYYYAPFWQYPVVPTTAYCPVGNMVVPPTLPGNSSIYFNYAGINDGSATAPQFVTNLYLDGQNVIGFLNYDILPGGWFSTCGYSSSARGGRHTLGMVADIDNDVDESDETDNNWAHQFVFTPYVMSESTPVHRGKPPIFGAGIDHIVDGSLIGYNCDGFRISSTGWWNAVILHADDDQHDYDLDLFAPSTGAENGFLMPLASSFAVEGELDAVIVNRNVTGIVDYDLGVYKYFNDDDSWFTIEQVISEPAWVDIPIAASYGTGEYLKIWDAYFGSSGWHTIFVDDLWPIEEVKVVLLPHDTAETSLSNFAVEITDDNGQVRLNQNIPTPGYYGLMVYRDQLGGGLAKTINVEIKATPPDLLPDRNFTWASPLIPTPEPVPGGNVPVLPDTLHGYLPATYANFVATNESPVPSPAVDVAVRQDGILFPYAPFTSPVMPPYSTWESWGNTPIEYPGGRHVMSLHLDHTDSIEEIYETNNVYGEQFCWSPLPLSPGQQSSRSAPADPYGGWETVDSGGAFEQNCDGYRLVTGGAAWEGMVLTQGPNSDYDLSVHHALVGVKEGFDDYLWDSYWLEGETDYVLFNNYLLTAAVHDVGVYNMLGDEEYVIEAVGSTDLPVPVDGRYGPYSLPPAHMLHLYNVYLEQDLYAFRLDNLSGTVDWGLTLHPNNLPYLARADFVPGGATFHDGPGAAEFFAVEVPAAGWYALAVYKTGPFEFEKDGIYQLTIRQGVTDVPDQPAVPAATALAGAHPNPFNPRTTLAFDLATDAAVDLSIYDLKGARIRRLVHRQLPAGRHEAVWKGQDDTGQRVASGVYLARFTAGAHREIKKVVMVK